MRLLIWTCVLLLGVGVECARGGIGGIFEKKPKPTPAEQVVELLNTLKNDVNSSKRARAAEGLRDFDIAMFTDIVPALLEALEKDSSANVRREAAQSLGRIRPTSAIVSQALERAMEKDSSTLVRIQARTARIGYRVSEPAPTEVTTQKQPAEENPMRPSLFSPRPKLMTPMTQPLPKPMSEKPPERIPLLDSKPLPPPSPVPLPAPREAPEGRPEAAKHTSEGPILISPRP